MIAQELHKQKEGIKEESNKFVIGGSLIPFQAFRRPQKMQQQLQNIPTSKADLGNYRRMTPEQVTGHLLTTGLVGAASGAAAPLTVGAGLAFLGVDQFVLGPAADRLRKNKEIERAKQKSLQMIKDYEYEPVSSTKDVNPKSTGGPIGPEKGRPEKALWSDLGMLAPALGNLGTLAGVVNSTPDKINIPRIRGNQRMQTDMPYNPMDTNYMLSRLSAQAGATRRGLIGMASGNRGAATSALLSADYNYSQGIGDIYNRARDYNRQQLMQNMQMANQARQANAQLDMQEQAYNQQAYTSEWDINARNMAARRNAINQGTQALTSNLSDLSRYLRDSTTISNMFRDYDSIGRYRNR